VIPAPLLFTAFGLFGSAALLFLFFLARRLIQIHSIRRDTPSLLLLAEKAVRVTEKAHLSPPRETGWIGWKDQVIEKMPQYSQSLDRMTGFILEAAYAGRPTLPRDLKYSRMLLKRLRRHFGKGGS